MAVHRCSTCKKHVDWETGEVIDPLPPGTEQLMVNQQCEPCRELGLTAYLNRKGFIEDASLPHSDVVHALAGTLPNQVLPSQVDESTEVFRVSPKLFEKLKDLA